MEILQEPTSNKLLVANELTDAFVKPFEVLNNVFENPDGYSCWPKGRQFTTSCPLFKLILDDSKKTYNITSTTLMYIVMIKDRVSIRVPMSQPHKMAMFYNKDD
nr:hypothetical protein [Tanacetum cinerariifolium]